MYFKSDAEIEVISKACSISSEAMLDTMVASKQNPDERHLSAVFEFGCNRRGADRLSFPTVVAGGERATMLHYERNDNPIGENDLVLVDGGAQYGHYNCDLARTWPISGKFTQSQLDIYNSVLLVRKGFFEANRITRSIIRRTEFFSSSNSFTVI